MTDNLPEMPRNGSKYGDDDRDRVICLYAVKGNMNAVSRETGICKQTLSAWKREPWFVARLERLRTEKADEHIALFDQFASDAMAVARQGMDNLDVTTMKANDVKAMLVASATAVDKSRLLQGLSTSNTNNNAATIEALKAKFEAIEDEHRRLEANQQAIDNTVVSEQ